METHWAELERAKRAMERAELEKIDSTSPGVITMNLGWSTIPLTHGYTIGLEWCGYAEQRHVVRQYDEWIGQYETRGRAEHEIEIVRGGNLPK